MASFARAVIAIISCILVQSHRRAAPDEDVSRPGAPVQDSGLPLLLQTKARQSMSLAMPMSEFFEEDAVPQPLERVDLAAHDVGVGAVPELIPEEAAQPLVMRRPAHSMASLLALHAADPTGHSMSDEEVRLPDDPKAPGDTGEEGSLVVPPSKSSSKPKAKAEQHELPSKQRQQQEEGDVREVDEEEEEAASDDSVDVPKRATKEKAESSSEAASDDSADVKERKPQVKESSPDVERKKEAAANGKKVEPTDREDVEGDNDEETAAATPSPSGKLGPQHGGHCTPTCTWSCESPTCDEVCEPVCQAPRCETRCAGPSMKGCSMECAKPHCSVVCPKGCPSEGCPSCSTKCGEPQCKLQCPKTQQCETVCEQPQCDWNCKAPLDCPKPKCSMVCESPEKCKSSSFSAELPPLKPGQLAVQSFTAPSAAAHMVVEQDPERQDGMWQAAAPGAPVSNAVMDVHVRSAAAAYAKNLAHRPWHRIVSMPVL